MTRYIFTLIIALAAWTGMAASAITEKVDSAYAADNFTEALTLYQQAMEADGPSAALWYNIGNTRYRLGETGQAILAYERSLRLDPTDRDTRANLDFVVSRTTDRPGDTGSFISNSADAIAASAAPNTWAWVALGIFALCIAAAAMYIFGSGVMLRKTGFFSAIVLLIATVAAVAIALRAASNATATDRAVITAGSTILSTSPREPKDRSEEAMMLHEGTRVTILDSVAAPGDASGLKWYDVSIDNHHRAWIKSSDVEVI